MWLCGCSEAGYISCIPKLKWINPFGTFKSLQHDLLAPPCPRLPYIYSFFHISEVQEQRILHPLEKVCIGLQFCTVFSCSLWSFILPLRNPITEPHNHSHASDSHRGLGKTKRFESGGLRCYSSKEMPAGASSAALDAALGGWGHFKPRTKGLWEHSLPLVKTSQAAEGGARVFLADSGQLFPLASSLSLFL